MIKPQDYDTAVRGGEFKRLPANGYVCKIIRAEETTSKAGKPMLKVAIDIHDGSEFEGYFRDQFENRLKYNDNATWPCVSYVVQTTDEGKTSGAFKNFVESIRESNYNWEPEWNERFCDKLRGTLLGVVFVTEEYINNEGKLRTSTKPDYGHYCSVDDIHNGNFTVPPIKKLEDDVVERTINQDSYDLDADIPEGFTTIDEDDLPF